MSMITVKDNILRYIFLKAKYVYSDGIYDDETPAFLEKLTMEICRTGASDSEMMRLIDLAIMSTNYKLKRS